MRAFSLAWVVVLSVLWGGCGALWAAEPTAHQTAAFEPFPADWFNGSPQQRALHDSLVGKPPPTLDLADWFQGHALQPSDLRRKIVLIHFWATWCGPCLASIPSNNEIASQYRDRGVLVMGVCSSSTGQQRMEEVARNRQIAYPVARDPDLKSAKAWHVQFWPTFALIDRHGVVRAVGLRRDKIGEAIEQLLAEQPPEPEGPDAEKLVQAPDPHLPDEWREGDDDRRAMLAQMETQPLPPLQVTQWVNSAPVDLSRLHGKVVLLHFWTNKPGTGLRGVTRTRELARRYQPEGLVIIGIFVGDDLATYKDMIRRYPLDYPLAFDQSGVTAAAFKVNDYPDYFLIDRAGKLRIADCSDFWLQIAVRRMLREAVGEDLTQPKSEPDAGADER